MIINRTFSKTQRRLLDLLATVLLLALSYGISMILLNVLTVPEHISTVFLFAVFLISMTTDGYFWGILASAVSLLAINYAFTFPYLAFDFTSPDNLLSALIMVTVSLLTSALTTRRKEWQKIKTASEREMMRANLLRAVSHDLRTPLTTIYGSSSAILENYDTLTEEQKTKMIDGINADAEWLIHMVENLLSVTKLGDGSLKLVKTSTVLEELIDAVLSKFRKRYPVQPVLLSLPEEMVCIPMDATLIEQVLTNLLENAILHAEGMTELSVTVYTQNGKAVFEVADNGAGIAKDRLDTLFTGYISKTETSSDTKKRNVGIGLSLCASIIKAHGGEISAENRASGGALFRFTLDTDEVTDEQ